MASAWRVAESLDFSSLEKLPCEFVTDDLRRRVSDSLWRVRLRDRGWLYLMLMLECQSTVDPWGEWVRSVLLPVWRVEFPAPAFDNTKEWTAASPYGHAGKRQEVSS